MPKCKWLVSCGIILANCLSFFFFFQFQVSFSAFSAVLAKGYKFFLLIALILTPIVPVSCHISIKPSKKIFRWNWLSHPFLNCYNFSGCKYIEFFFFLENYGMFITCNSSILTVLGSLWKSWVPKRYMKANYNTPKYVHQR